MVWPENVELYFSYADKPDATAPEFHQPWLYLLHEVLVTTPHTLVPMKMCLPTGDDRVFIYDVRIIHKPVALLQVKAPKDLASGSVRAIADQQIREQLRRRIDECPFPIMHALSAMGTRMRFYSLAKEPNAQVQPPETAEVSAELWSDEVLSEEGEAKLRAVFGEVIERGKELWQD